MFGCIVAGRPVQTNLQAVSTTQFVFTLPSPSTINHLVVFLLPDTALPPTHAATVHIRLPGRQNFQLLGAISAAKPSAIFRVRGMRDDGDDEGVSMVDDGGEVTLGVSVEDVQSVEAQMAGLQTGAGSGTVALVPKMDTLRVAQKVIGNAFDYLASFARGGQGEEVVPLKAFQEWWRKFEGRVQSDPGYLERA